jgi:hypothetical protein
VTPRTRDTKPLDDDPAPHEHRARLLIQLSQFDDGYAAAVKAMELHVARGDDVPSICLETIDAYGVRIDVLLNRGPAERLPPDTESMRPLSFLMYYDGSLLGRLHWEVRRTNGQEVAAGFSTGPLGRPGRRYSEIRAMFLEQLQSRLENFDQLDPRKPEIRD